VLGTNPEKPLDFRLAHAFDFRLALKRVKAVIGAKGSRMGSTNTFFAVVRPNRIPKSAERAHCAPAVGRCRGSTAM